MGVPLTGTLDPQGDFPATIDVDNKGGFRVVDDATERNAIPHARRTPGMEVKTADTGETWILKPSPWTDADLDWELETPTGQMFFGSSAGGSPATLLDARGAELVLVSGYTYGLTITAVLTGLSGRALFMRHLVVHTNGGLGKDFDFLAINAPLGTGWTFTTDVSGGTLHLVAAGAPGVTIHASAKVDIVRVSTTGTT